MRRRRCQCEVSETERTEACSRELKDRVAADREQGSYGSLRRNRKGGAHPTSWGFVSHSWRILVLIQGATGNHLNVEKRKYEKLITLNTELTLENVLEGNKNMDSRKPVQGCCRRSGEK